MGAFELLQGVRYLGITEGIFTDHDRSVLPPAYDGGDDLEALDCLQDLALSSSGRDPADRGISMTEIKPDHVLGPSNELGLFEQLQWIGGGHKPSLEIERLARLWSW